MTRREAAAKLTDEVFWRALQSNMAWPPKVGWDAARRVILDALGLPEQEPTCAWTFYIGTKLASTECGEPLVYRQGHEPFCAFCGKRLVPTEAP